MLFVDIEKRIGDFILKVSFETRDNVLSLLGASGSGKSMTLKCIAGVETPDKGRIVLNDRVLFDSEKGINVCARKRRVGYLFQHYALFPNMSVRQNIEVALHNLPKEERVIAADEIVKQFKLEEIENKMPRELSGGEKQRTAFARVMANNPEVLLLDEPFSALDDYLKWQILVDVKKAVEGFKKDIVFVTHNMDEVMALSDTICVLNDGLSETVKTVNEAFIRPESVSSAKLFGCRNFTKIEKCNDANPLSDDTVIKCLDWNIKLKIKTIRDSAMYAGIFSRDIKIVEMDDANEEQIPCTVFQIIHTAEGTEALLSINGTDNYMYASFSSETDIKINDAVYAYIAPEKLLILEE